MWYCITGWTVLRLLLLHVGADVELYLDTEKKSSKSVMAGSRNERIICSFFPFCIDATYKLLELGIPVYVMVCVDFNGQTELVAACIRNC